MDLLVSVTSVEEALEAAAGGADIIDVKNPREGALGANFPWVLSDVRRCVGGGVRISATLGDLPYLPGTASLAAFGAASCGVDYVKVGLFGARGVDEAFHMISSVCRSVKNFTRRPVVVAAGYADFPRYGCIDPLKIPYVTYEAGGGVAMIDVKEKGVKGLFSYMSFDKLKRFVDEAHSYGLKTALAGGLGKSDMKTLLELGADVMGVRRCVCRGSEAGFSVRRGLVEDLAQAVSKKYSVQSNAP